MGRTKKLYILLGILVVVCAITFGVSKYEEEKEIIKNSDEIILELDSEAVTKLSWEYEEESLSFYKDEVWKYEEDESFPVDEEKVKELLGIFESFGASFCIEEVEDYGQYGLDDPVCTINIETEEDAYEIQLGDFSTMDEERYVSLGDGNVYLVTSDPYDPYAIALKDMIKNDELPSFEQINQVTFEGTENYTVSYEEDSTNTYSEDDVYFTKQSNKTVPLDTDRLEDYLDAVSDLGQQEYVTYNATEDELAVYGLDDPELTLTVNYSWEDEETEEEMEDTFVLHVSRDPEELAAAAEKEGETEDDEAAEEASEEEEITAYMRVEESPIIYKITGDEYESLMKVSYNDLRHQRVLWADYDDIYQVDITLEDEKYTITSEVEDEERIYYYGEKELEIADFKSALKALTADEFTNEKATLKEEISMTVYLENENDPEVEIALYRYDGEHCLAVVDGASVSLVSRSDVVELVETVNAIVLSES